jgi:hypothetical protein
MIEERELQRRLRAAISAVSVPSVPLRSHDGQRNSLGLAFASVGLITVLVAAFVVGQLLSAYRTEVASSPTSSLVPIPSIIDRADAIALVRGLGREVGRVDRIEAKLLTWQEYLLLAGAPRLLSGDPGATPVPGNAGFVGDPSTRFVWVVAVSGEIWPIGRDPIWWGGPPPVPNPSPYPPYRWAVFIIDATQGQLMVVPDAGVNDSWPAVFDKLPDHPVASSVSRSSAPSLPALPVRTLATEATATVLRLTGALHRVDRIQVKLMTWGEYLAGGDRSLPKPAGASADTPLWIVALSGEVARASDQPATYRWGVFAIEVSQAQIMSSTGSNDGDWPPFFDALPDHPPRT